MKHRHRVATLAKSVGRFAESPRSSERGYDPPRSRHGWTLIQMMVAISVLSVLSMAAITMVIATMQTEARAATVWVNDRQFARLSNDWRKDAHAARFAEVTRQNDQPILIFKANLSATRMVSYVVQPNQVLRRETDGDKLLRLETYRLPDWQLTFAFPGSNSAESSGESLTLKSGDVLQATCRRPYSTRVRSNITQPRRDDHIVAVIGRDLRFEKSATTEANRDAK